MEKLSKDTRRIYFGGLNQNRIYANFPFGNLIKVIFININ